MVCTTPKATAPPSDLELRVAAEARPPLLACCVCVGVCVCMCMCMCVCARRLPACLPACLLAGLLCVCMCGRVCALVACLPACLSCACLPWRCSPSPPPPPPHTHTPKNRSRCAWACAPPPPPSATTCLPRTQSSSPAYAAPWPRCCASASAARRRRKVGGWAGGWLAGSCVCRGRATPVGWLARERVWGSPLPPPLRPPPAPAHAHARTHARTPPPPPIPRAALARQQRWLQWAVTLLLGSSYPGAPHERAFFALELLLVVACAFGDLLNPSWVGWVRGWGGFVGGWVGGWDGVDGWVGCMRLLQG